MSPPPTRRESTPARCESTPARCEPPLARREWTPVRREPPLARRELSVGVMRSRGLALLLTLLIPAAFIGVVAHVADAQTRRPGATAPRPAGAARGSPPTATADAGVAPGTLSTPKPAPPSASAAAAAAGKDDTGVVEAKNLDGGRTSSSSVSSTSRDA